MGTHKRDLELDFHEDPYFPTEREQEQAELPRISATEAHYILVNGSDSMTAAQVRGLREIADNDDSLDGELRFSFQQRD